MFRMIQWEVVQDDTKGLGTRKLPFAAEIFYHFFLKTVYLREYRMNKLVANVD